MQEVSRPDRLAACCAACQWADFDHAALALAKEGRLICGFCWGKAEVAWFGAFGPPAGAEPVEGAEGASSEDIHAGLHAPSPGNGRGRPRTVTAASKPWEAEGISRSAWYRKKEPAP